MALGAEFGGVSAVVRKWADDVQIRLQGLVGQEDVAVLNAVTSELNELGPPRMSIVTDDSTQTDLLLHFGPQSSFPEVLPDYVPGNAGFFWMFWNERSEIFTAIVLIDNSESISQTFRNHLIREEMTQVLGLARDSFRFSNSVFYEGETTPQAYSEIDRTAISIHKLDKVRPGMTEVQVRGLLSALP